MNDYQKSFFKYLAIAQEEIVQIALLNYKDGDDIQSLLYDVTYGAMVEIMLVIDGYSTFSEEKMDIINSITGKGLKENPFLELHDQLEDYLKC